jgi:hypothetical protein
VEHARHASLRLPIDMSTVPAAAWYGAKRGFCVMAWFNSKSA